MNKKVEFKLLKSSSAKLITVCLLYMVGALLAFIMFMGPHNYILYSLIITIYSVLLAFGVYIMFNTKNKLVMANTFFGICFLVMAFGLYSIFIYNLVEINFMTVSLAVIALVLLFMILEFIVIKQNNLIYKHKDRRSSGVLGYFIGTAIGPVLLSFIKSKFGENGEFDMVISICLLGALGLFFSGTFFMKKSLLIKKYNSSEIIIVYGDETY